MKSIPLWTKATTSLLSPIKPWTLTELHLTTNKALLYASILSIFHQFSGINGVIFFSNSLFTHGQEGNKAEMNARIGTLCIGIVGLVGTAMAIPSLKYFKRLTLIKFCSIIMGICLACLGVFSITIEGGQVKIIAVSLVFIWVFNFGLGPIMWIYSSEIVDERGCALGKIYSRWF